MSSAKNEIQNSYVDFTVAQQTAKKIAIKKNFISIQTFELYFRMQNRNWIFPQFLASIYNRNCDITKWVIDV